MRMHAGTHISLIISTIILAFGCNPVSVPLKGSYSTSAVEITTNQSGDSVWSKVNALFTAHGLPIKSIDRQKGTITTRKTTTNAAYTYENTDGQFEQPGAWVVLTKVYNKDKEWKLRDIHGTWNIQVSETGKGTTSVKIDPYVMCRYFPNSFTAMESRGLTTGKLEKLLELSLKGN